MENPGEKGVFGGCNICRYKMCIYIYIHDSYIYIIYIHTEIDTLVYLYTHLHCNIYTYK